jgi:hypothetical protein
MVERHAVGELPIQPHAAQVQQLKQVVKEAKTSVFRIKVALIARRPGLGDATR